MSYDDKDFKEFITHGEGKVIYDKLASLVEYMARRNGKSNYHMEQFSDLLNELDLLYKFSKFAQYGTVTKRIDEQYLDILTDTKKHLKFAPRFEVKQ